MRRLVLLPVLVAAALAVAACGSSGTTNAPSSAASAPAASVAGGAACATADAGATAAKTVEIKDFKFSTDPVSASVGDVIGWTNGDSAQHTATLDDGSCGTENLSQGATGLLVFSEAGTYPYHCSIHPTQMMGTIEVQ
jgi:plastocyanin